VARYRKIDPRIWNDRKFRSLSDDGRLAFLFLLTHPGLTALGAMRATWPGLAAEIGWPLNRWTEATMPAAAAGMVEINADAAYVGLPNFLRYNEPEGPNSVAKAWPAALDLIPECPERQRLVRRCLAYLERTTPEFQQHIGPALKLLQDAIHHVMSDPILDAMSDPGTGTRTGTGAGAVQEPKDTHITQTSPSASECVSPEIAKARTLSPDGLVALWNRIVRIPRVASLPARSRRRACARAALADHPDAAYWQSLFARVRDTPFLQGGGANGWRASFDWIITPDHAARVLEGAYDARAPTDALSSPDLTTYPDPGKGSVSR
jgi:hypothetical protein